MSCVSNPKTESYEQKVPLKDVPFKPILVAITPENKLVQYDTTTGEKGAEIDMGPLKFKHLEFTKDEGLHIYMGMYGMMLCVLGYLLIIMLQQKP